MNNLKEKVEKYLNEKVIINWKELEGKEVKITTRKKAKYSGILHVSSSREIVLSDLGILDKEGNLKAKSKQGEKRKFKIANIESVEEL